MNYHAKGINIRAYIEDITWIFLVIVKGIRDASK